MKQYINQQQFEELSSNQQAKIMKRWCKNVGDLIFCKPEFNENVYYGVITEIKSEKAYSSWDMHGTTAPTMRIMNSVWYPLFSYGQLIEILIDLYDSSFDFNNKTIDDLWESIKEKL